MTQQMAVFATDEMSPDKRKHLIGRVEADTPEDAVIDAVESEGTPVDPDLLDGETLTVWTGLSDSESVAVEYCRSERRQGEGVNWDEVDMDAERPLEHVPFHRVAEEAMGVESQPLTAQSRAWLAVEEILLRTESLPDDYLDWSDDAKSDALHDVNLVHVGRLIEQHLSRQTPAN